MENDCQKPSNSKPSVIAQIFNSSKKDDQTKEQKSLLPITVEPKKQVMSLMDTLLTLFIVSPLIVGQWRGTWDLMDYYETAFPAWESFLFGGALHLSFAIMRDGLQDLIKFQTGSLAKNILAYSLRRMYTYFFAAACIMNWRGAWIIFDDWVGVEFSPDGRVTTVDCVPLFISVPVVSLVLLAILRSFRNILAAPFVIGLDTKSTAFDFPTRYRITILYTTIYAIKSNSSISIENTNNTKNTSSSSPTAEKLAASQITVEKQTIEHISPRPFLNDLRGASPSGFSPSYGPPTTPNYIHPNHRPQLQQHPHNIQDIIEYISENAHRQKELLREEQKIAHTNNYDDRFKLYGTFQSPKYTHQQPHDFHFSRQHFPQDPFFAFKPQDPSDINLLAPSSFRFAPSILTTNFYKNRQKLLHDAANLSRYHNPKDALKRPLSLTLNIYSSPYEDQFGNENRLQFQGPGVTPRYKYPFADLQGRPLLKPRRMVVHLNVYPGANTGLSSNSNNNNNEENVEGRYQQIK